MSYLTFSKSQWFRDQFDEEKYPVRLIHPSQYVESALSGRRTGIGGSWGAQRGELACLTLEAAAGGTPLRSRLTHAISQFVVASVVGSNFPDYVAAAFWDTIKVNTAGTITELLQAVSLCPAMAIYLTFWGKTKADPATGVEPDENYARELLQLFTVGVVELEEDGTPKLVGGEEQEIYGPADISQLARVFTGFVKPGMEQNLYDTESPHITSVGASSSFWRDTGTSGGDLIDLLAPLHCMTDWHEWGAKSFLGIEIPAVTDEEEQTVAAAQDEIRYAVAEICKHPNVIPFWARRLIQFMTRENPSSEYVEHVTAAGRAGLYILPDESVVGSGEPGDLQAMAAAVLFHEEAHTINFSDPNAGRVLTMWEMMVALYRWHGAKEALFPPDGEHATCRDFWEREPATSAENPEYLHWSSGAHVAAARMPFNQPSVFGFGSPGFVAVGTPAGAAGLTTPGLQNQNWANYPGMFDNANWTNNSPSENSWTWSATCLRADELTLAMPDHNAAMVADSDAYVDMLGERAFGGLLSTETLDLLKLHAAKNVTDDNNTITRGVNDDTASGCQMGAAGVYALGMFSVEWTVQR